MSENAPIVGERSAWRTCLRRRGLGVYACCCFFKCSCDSRVGRGGVSRLLNVRLRFPDSPTGDSERSLS